MTGLYDVIEFLCKRNGIRISEMCNAIGMRRGLMLGFLSVAALCEALAGGGLLCWLVCALCLVSCNWCCGLLLPAAEMAEREK